LAIFFIVSFILRFNIAVPPPSEMRYTIFPTFAAASSSYSSSFLHLLSWRVDYCYYYYQNDD